MSNKKHFSINCVVDVDRWKEYYYRATENRITDANVEKEVEFDLLSDEFGATLPTAIYNQFRLFFTENELKDNPIMWIENIKFN